MSEDLLDHQRILDAGDDPDGATAGSAGLDVDVEHPLQALSPGHRNAAFARRFLFPSSAGVGFAALASLSRRNLYSVFAVRGEYTIISTPSCS